MIAARQCSGRAATPRMAMIRSTCETVGQQVVIADRKQVGGNHAGECGGYRILARQLDLFVLLCVCAQSAAGLGRAVVSERTEFSNGRSMWMKRLSGSN